MDTLRFALWIFLSALFFGVLQILQIPVRKKCGYQVRFVLFAVKFLLSVLIAYIIVATDELIAWRSGFLFAAIYVALFGDALSDIVTLPYVIYKKHKDCTKIQIISGACLTAAYLIYGTLNMQIVTPKHFEMHSPKLESGYTIVFLSDLHVGSSQSFDTALNTLQMIRDEKPDLILLGGDITDEYTTLEEMKKTYEMIGQLGAPVYFIYGNHDRQTHSDLTGGRTYSDEDLLNALESNGIVILEDSWTAFADDLVILGRGDAGCENGRIPTGQIPERPSDSFVISVDHTPYETEDIIEAGADLQLSGHTHAGQLFPLRFLYELTDHDACGVYHYGNTELYVSSGASGWSFPFRTEAACHYDVISLSR